MSLGREVQILTLKLAVNRKLEEKFPGDDNPELEALGDKLAAMFEPLWSEDPAEQKRIVAEANDLTVRELIDCPNYKVLMDEYQKNMGDKVVAELMKELDFTDQEARVFIMMTQEQI